MTILLFANNAASSLAGAITNTATSANLAPGSGALFPAPAAGQAFKGTFTDQATGLVREIVLVTGVVGDTITMVRGQEGTAAANWLAGDLFNNLITAGTMAAMLQTAQAQSARTVVASGPFVITAADGAVGLNRLVAPAVSSATLPPAPFNGQIVQIEDEAGNFNAFPVTISPNVGQAIRNFAGAAVLNVNGQCAQFRWYADSNLWSFKP